MLLVFCKFLPSLRPRHQARLQAQRPSKVVNGCRWDRQRLDAAVADGHGGFERGWGSDAQVFLLHVAKQPAIDADAAHDGAAVAAMPAQHCQFAVAAVALNQAHEVDENQRLGRDYAMCFPFSRNLFLRSCATGETFSTRWSSI